MYETVEEFAEKVYDDGKSDGRSEQAMDTLDIPKNERNKYMTML